LVQLLKEQKSSLLEQQNSDSAASQRIKDVVNILNASSAEFTEWNESLVRQMVDTVKVLSADRTKVYFRGGGGD